MLLLVYASCCGLRCDSANFAFGCLFVGVVGFGVWVVVVVVVIVVWCWFGSGCFVCCWLVVCLVILFAS